jgi:hypothetical protein
MSGGELYFMMDETNAILAKPTSEKKLAFMRLLVANPNIVSIINNPNIETPDDLINQNIFPRLKVDFVATDASTYIGLKLDYPNITENEDYKDCVVTFMIISHISDIAVESQNGASKTDLLGEEITKMFNFNYKLGFTLKLIKDTEDPFNEKYYYRRLTFKTIDYNDIDNKVNNGV